MKFLVRDTDRSGGYFDSSSITGAVSVASMMLNCAECDRPFDDTARGIDRAILVTPSINYGRVGAYGNDDVYIGMYHRVPCAVRVSRRINQSIRENA